MEIQDLDKEIKDIHQRNRRVEAEKAWERSWSRTAWVLAATYIIAGIVFVLIEVPHPWRNALIPTIAYFISTQSLPFLKRQWISRYMKSHGRD